jgi:hypothetical protein
MDVEDDLPQYDCAEVVPVPKALQGQNPECFHDLKAEDMCGTVIDFKQFCGKVVVVVNVASL